MERGRLRIKSRLRKFIPETEHCAIDWELLNSPSAGRMKGGTRRWQSRREDIALQRGIHDGDDVVRGALFYCLLPGGTKA